ncbi:hypothetical protein NQ315_015554 [Exocentrus adspersus]|uniref:C2H2-type domain-containing protein n=1 Tax=Exocentrus adspersus TaxID=1586481 RepID=A0AAV8V5X6_9CUCU|nr:hypothetical protein NQ315_015554 [Exocentrus adspersus]
MMLFYAIMMKTAPEPHPRLEPYTSTKDVPSVTGNLHEHDHALMDDTINMKEHKMFIEDGIIDTVKDEEAKSGLESRDSKNYLACESEDDRSRTHIKMEYRCNENQIDEKNQPTTSAALELNIKDTPFKIENLKYDSTIDDAINKQKHENLIQDYITVKTEKAECESGSSSQPAKNADGSKQFEYWVCSACKSEPQSYEVESFTKLDPHLHMFKSCSICQNTIMMPREFSAPTVPIEQHACLVRKHPSTIWQHNIDLCNYKSKRDHLKDFTSIYKDCSNVTWHKCELCDFMTKEQNDLNGHMLIHVCPPEIKYYKCDFCDYQAKQKYHLKRHMLVHKDAAGMERYKCQFCDYESRRKKNWANHMLVHKDTSEIKWHKCDLCDYKAKHRNNLRNHVLIHKDPSEIIWQKCDFCEYKTKWRTCLNTHMIIHKDPLKITWHECDQCGFKTKWKHHLKNHVMIHRRKSKS